MADIKILLVEAESIEAVDIKRTLESFNYEVPYIASSGEEAVEKALEIMPDLILIDIILKGETDGIEVASKIKNLNIPIIYLTAHSEESTIERAKRTEPYGYIIKPYDHTELKYAIELALYKHKTEIKLKESEKQYRNILENIQDAYIRVNEEGDIIMVSPSASRMYRYDSPQEMVGIPAVSLYKNPERRLVVLEDLKQEDQVGDFEGEALRNDGTSFWASINIQFIRDDQGMIQGTEAFIRDITQRKKAENEIKKSENYYRAIFDHTGTATVIIGEDTTISLANTEFEKLSGYSRKEIEGKKSWTDFVMKDDLEMMKEYHNLRRIDSRSAPDFYEFRFTDKAGDVKNIQLDIGMIPGTKKSVASLLNITERKLAVREIKNLFEIEREALKDAEESKEEMFNILERVSDSFVALDKNWHYTYVNKNGAEHFGKTPEEMIGNHIWTMFPEGIDQPFYKAYHQAMEEQKYIHLEEYYEPYGRWFRNDIYPSEDGITIFFKDITDEKEAEKVLKENENKLRYVLENSLDVAYRRNLNTSEYDYLSPVIEKVIGYSLEEFTSMSVKEFLELVHPEDKENVIDNYVNIYSGKVDAIEIEFRIKQKEGQYKWINDSASLNKEDNSTYVVGTVRDITERKAAEKSLKKSAERFRAVAESAVDAIVTTDSEGNIIFFNDSLTTIFGYTKGEITGKPLTILMPERFKNKYLEELIKYKKSGKHRLVGKTVSTNGLKKDGTEFPFEMSLSAWGSGGKTYFTSIIRDITLQKIAEEKMKDHVKKLTIINKVISTANKASDINSLLKEVLISIMDLLGFESGGIYLLEKNTGFSELAYYENLPGEFLEKVKRLKVDVEPYSTVYDRGIPIYNYIEIKPEIETLYGFKSAATVPIFSAGKVIGSLNMVSNEKSFTTDLEKDILESIGVQTGTVIAKMYSEAAIKESLREKELLITEIHHRVKNNMQIISSLLNLQSQYVEGDELAADVLKESQNRVKSMAMVHEKLYQSTNLTSIEFDGYIKSLVSDLFYTYKLLEDQIKPVIDIEKIKLNMETAIPCGLIINELVSNSLKHAFPEKRKGEIHVSLKTLNNEYELDVSDNGVGFPDGLDFKNTNSLGLQLVRSLVNQVDGKIELEKNHGTKFKITFKELKYKERF